MTTQWPLCEFEDSADCIWDAQNQGNGIGESFVDVGGTAIYFDCPVNKVPGWLDENGEPQGCVDNNATPLVVPEAEPIEVPEAVASVSVEPTPPEWVDTGVHSVDAGLLAFSFLVAVVLVTVFRKRS